VIFSLAKQAQKSVFVGDELPPKYFAYVEWFLKFSAVAEDNHLMYKIRHSFLSDGRRDSSIIPVEWVQWSVHLIPRFGPVAPRTWKALDVLEQAEAFYINLFTDQHTYITVY